MSNIPDKPHFRLLAYLRNLFFLSAGVVLLLLAFRGQNLKELFNKIVEVNYFWFIVSLIIVTPAHILRAARWNLLINPLGYKPSLLNTFNATMAGYFTNLALPKLGEVFRCWALRETDQIKGSKLLGTVVVERIIDTITLLLLISIVLIFKYDLLSDFFINNVLKSFINRTEFLSDNHHLISYLILLFLIILLFFVIVKRNRISKISVVIKFRKKLSGLREGLSTIRKLKSRKLFIIYSILIWLIYFISFQVSFYAMESTADIGFFEGFIVFAFSGMAWAAPIQGGIGAYHWITTKGLVFIGINASYGLVFSTVKHATSILYNLAIGGLCLSIILWKRKNISKNISWSIAELSDDE